MRTDKKNYHILQSDKSSKNKNIRNKNVYVEADFIQQKDCVRYSVRLAKKLKGRLTN